MIADYFTKRQKDERDILTERVCNDLDFNSFFETIDYTTSKPGQQYLYNQLRSYSASQPDFAIQEDILKRFGENQSLFERVSAKLGKLNKYEAYYINQLFQDKLVEKPSWYWLVPVLSFASVALSVLAFFNLKFLSILIGVVVLNLVVHYWNKKNVMQYISAIPQLFLLCITAKELSKEQLAGMPDVSKELQTILKLKGYFRFFKVENGLGSDASLAFWGLFELIKITFLIEPILFFKTIEKINLYREQVHRIYSFVGQMDVFVSVYKLRQEAPYYCKPEIIDSNQLQVEAIYHPLVENCVSNDLHLNNCSALITGSNMSGKTSLIRAVGLNALAAYTLNTCFARKMGLPKLKLLSAIRISDDLLNSKSYYFEEVLTIRHMLEESDQQPCLLLIDELFKGTNTTERIAIAKSTLSYMARNNSMVLVATHDIELAELLKGEFKLFHFCEKVNDKHIDFDYIIKKGPLKHTNAIKILEANGYPLEVLHAANKLVDREHVSINVSN